MLLNHARALARMERLGLDALVASAARNVYYASGFWTRISEWGFQEPQASVIIPRDPALAPTLVVPEFAIAGLLETPTWIPRVCVTEFMNTSFVGREPEPVRLDPLQADVEKLYAEKVVGDLAPNIVVGTARALRELGLSGARVGFDDLRLANWVQRELPALKTSDAHDVWLDIRKVKTAQELEFMQHGARLNEAGLREILPMIRPGVVWRDVAGRFRQYLQEHGANVLSAQKALQFGAEYGGEYFPTSCSPTTIGRCATVRRSSSRAGAAIRTTRSISHARCTSANRVRSTGGSAAPSTRDSARRSAICERE